MASKEESAARYAAAAHAMQTGVKMETELGSRHTEPKHLRVGVNSALVDSSALAELLIAKGVITDDEYLEAIAAGMEREAAAYQARISAKLGTEVTLA